MKISFGRWRRRVPSSSICYEILPLSLIYSQYAFQHLSAFFFFFFFFHLISSELFWFNLTLGP